LQAYRKEGIDIWGLTPQNEPDDGNVVYLHINNCGYSPEEERTFIADNLGPTLMKHKFGHVVFMNSDDWRTTIPDRQKVVSAYVDTLRGSSCAEQNKWH
jgi:glucosylceramidase